MSRRAIGAAAEQTRSDQRPTFVELSTYRRTGHFAADPARYRDQEELRRAEAGDPIKRFGDHLTSQLDVAAQTLATITRESEDLVAAAVATAKQDRELTAAETEELRVVTDPPGEGAAMTARLLTAPTLAVLPQLVTDNIIGESSRIGWGSALAVVLLLISLGFIVTYLFQVFREEERT